MRLCILFKVCLFLCASQALAKASFETYKLKNGLELVTMASHKVPLVTIVLTFRAGGMTETKDINGLTHLWEHMFFKGNKSIPNQEAFNKRIRELGIVYNGDTSAEKVRYYFTLPSAFLEEGIKFMHDAITTPLLDTKELIKERKVVLDEYDRSAANPGFDSYRLTRAIIYGDQEHRRDPLGDRETIAKATKKQLLRISSEVFVPQNGALMISGDINVKETRRLVDKYFSSWKVRKEWTPPRLPTFQKFPKTTEYVMVRPLVQNAQVMISFDGPTAATSAKDTFSADMLISLLNVRSGKFYKRFVDSGLALDAGLSYPTQRYAGKLTVYAVCEPEKVAEVKEKLLAEVVKWTDKNYFNNEQLEDVRRSLLINHKREVNSPSDFIKSLAFWWPVTGLDYYRSYLDNLAKTSLVDIVDFSKKYFVKKPYVSSILLSPEGAKKAGLKDTSKKLMKKYLEM